MCVTGATTPQRLLLVADWGLSQNSSVTLQHLLQSAANTTTAPAVLYIADFCYAGQFFLLASLRLCNSALNHSHIGTVAHMLTHPNYHFVYVRELLVQSANLYMMWWGLFACTHMWLIHGFTSLCLQQ